MASRVVEPSERTPLLNSNNSNNADNDTTIEVQNSSESFSSKVDQVDAGKHCESVPTIRLERHASMDLTHPIALSWRNVSVWVNMPARRTKFCSGEFVPASEKQILKNISGLVPPGTLLAIMGASGAGKSTLLNILTRRNVKNYNFAGDICANGRPISDEIKELSAYVQQDDIFIPTLTVREQLQFRALLRMDKRLDRKARLIRVESVISEMGLMNCADSRIGNTEKRGISGGERKRLSFATEALTNPPIFFCDEPTSGLDTFMAQNIVTTLQKMASKGRTILCTIHQPSSELFSMFDQILLLAEGRTAFMGSRDEAITFFDRMGHPCPMNFNPGDHYILTLAIVPGNEEECRKRTKSICDAFLVTEQASNMATQTKELMQQAKARNSDPIFEDILAGNSRYEVSWFVQMRYLFWRSWISMFRDVILFRVRIMQALTLAIVLGLVYFQLDVNQKGVMNINGAIFLLITNTSFSNMFAVVNSFPLELGVFLREYGSGIYRADTYYLTKTFAEVPLFVAVSLIFVSITYWMIGLYASWEAYLIAAGVLVLTANVAISLGYLISTICGSVTVSLAVAPPLLIPVMLFGGLFVNNGITPVYFVWLEYISWFKYSNEILMVNEWRNIDHIPCPNVTLPGNMTTPYPITNCLYRTGDDVLDYTSFKESNLIFDFIMLVVLQVAFRILSLLALIIRARRSKE
ncbi:protein white-like [Physella acuta]|uniref:protein white-like n=1 Tax=Physella acuta TaxID=109671 RepID=UPI0027DDE312|nr:protein white-like [Physella acuta]